jgi:hypothetical protein
LRRSAEFSLIPLKADGRTSDLRLVDLTERAQREDQEALAQVIPLVPHRDVAAPDAPGEDELDAGEERAVATLARLVGPRWPEIPASCGRAGVRVEALLQQGPTALDPSATTVDVAISRVHAVLAGARVALGLLPRQIDVLGEALGADLRDAQLWELEEIAAAAVALGTMPRTVASWGSVAGAEAATVVLEVAAPDLREAARSHEELYARFTERVWDIPLALVRSGSRRWRPVARRRLRRALRAVSRTTALPGGIDRAAQTVLQAHRSRAAVAPLRPLLAQHLGPLERGPLTDVEGALASLAAVRELQRALGPRQDDRRLERLLLADAFGSRELARPAILVCSTLSSWAGDVASGGGSGALNLCVADLFEWVDRVSQDLPAVRRGWMAVRDLGMDAITPRELVDLLLLREKASELLDGDVPQPSTPAAPAADPSEPTDRRWSAS